MLLLKKMVEIAKAECIQTIYAQLLQENHAMQKLCSKLGFKMTSQETMLIATLHLY